MTQEPQSFALFETALAVDPTLGRVGHVSFDLLRRAHVLADHGSFAVLLLALVLLIGHWTGLPHLFMPAGQDAGTHILTASALLLLAAAQLRQRPLRPRSTMRLVALVLVTAIAAMRLAELALGDDPAALSHRLNSALHAGAAQQHVSMGLNTALALLCLGLAGLAARRRPALALWLTVPAFLLSLVAIIGASFGAPTLYGAMSLFTALAILPLALVQKVRIGHKPYLRMVYNDSTLGRMARLQLGFAMTVPWLAGWLIFQGLDDVLGAWEPFFVSLMVVLMIGLVTYSASLAEGAERGRRRLERHLLRLSVQDPLTGMLNREGLRRVYRRLSGEPLIMALIDIDFFKQVNDMHGHEAGDRVLRETGRLLRSELQSRDVLVRWGGEEFLVLAPGRAPEQVQADMAHLAGRLHHAVRGLQDPAGEGLTISIGLTLLEPGNEPLQDAIKRADDALLQAKDKGRDCFVIAGLPQGSAAGSGHAEGIAPPIAAGPSTA